MRNRLLWALLAETGLRLGEALGLPHRDWHPGLVTPHSWSSLLASTRTGAGQSRVSAGVFSDELHRLYGEHVWRLCEAAADLVADDFDAAYVSVTSSANPVRAVPAGVGL